MDQLLSDELWNAIAPLFPEHPPSAKGGRPRLADRDCLRGILFVLREGLRWQSLPKEMGCGSGSTCWRPTTAGVLLPGAAPSAVAKTMVTATWLSTRNIKHLSSFRLVLLTAL